MASTSTMSSEITDFECSSVLSWIFSEITVVDSVIFSSDCSSFCSFNSSTSIFGMSFVSEGVVIAETSVI